MPNGLPRGMVECQKKEQTLVTLEPRQQKRQVICVSPFFLDQVLCHTYKKVRFASFVTPTRSHKEIHRSHPPGHYASPIVPDSMLRKFSLIMQRSFRISEICFTLAFRTSKLCLFLMDANLSIGCCPSYRSLFVSIAALANNSYYW
jgi:hypothetical protein